MSERIHKQDKVLQFLHDRLIHVHGESENYDYMIHMRERIAELTRLHARELTDREKQLVHDALREYCQTSWGAWFRSEEEAMVANINIKIGLGEA